MHEATEGSSAFHKSLRELLLPHSNSPHQPHEASAERVLRLIDEDGRELGTMPAEQALQMAKDKGLDLFIVQPDSAPPVARLMDLARYKYKLEKGQREAKRKHPVTALKEIKLRYAIADHDYQVKLRSAIKILGHGDKIKVLTILRGREIAHKDLALALLEKFAKELKPAAIIDKEARIEGKSVIMVLSPARPTNRADGPS